MLRKRGNGSGNLKIVIFLFLLVGIIAFVKFSLEFEREKPVITAKDNIFWNLKDKINIKLNDKSGIKYYKIVLTVGNEQITLSEKSFIDIKKALVLEIGSLEHRLLKNNTKASIDITAIDISKWNFFKGNISTKNIKINIDSVSPLVSIISNSRSIRRGGSAAVVVKIIDTNLEDAYITFNNKYIFELTPFYKKDHYVALIAWPIQEKEFIQINLIAKDEANNNVTKKIPFFINKFDVKKDTINITDKFINTVSSNVLIQSNKKIPDNLQKRFVKQNEILRELNIKKIKSICDKNFDNKTIDNFNILPFKRLKRSRTAASFGELRSYKHNGKNISEAWHLGMDWASVKKDKIYVSNKGSVIYNDYLGIYGNTVIINHALGLSTLYAHTSSTNIKVGDTVIENQFIANTGTTGAVLGDHLHFGVLVQGIEVNPVEWMDKNWIKTRITSVLNDAKNNIN